MTQPPDGPGRTNPPDGGSQSGWGQPPQQPGSAAGWGQPQEPQPPQQPGSQSGWGQPHPPAQPQSGQQWSSAPETQQFNLGAQQAGPPPTQAQPAYQPGPYQPSGSAGGWQGGPGQGGPPKKSRKGLIIGIAAVVVLALVGGGLFFLLTGEDITYEDRAIVEPERVLSDAESRVSEIVEERGGAENDETSCYFVLKQAEETDIADQVLCGPVLFVDGDEGQSYLSFPVSASGGDDDATLTVAPDPDSAEPAEPADRALLIRPDGGTPAEGSGGLAVPDPRRAEPGFTASVDPGELDLASAGTYLGGLSVSFLLAGYGEADRIGQGDDARRPAEGERFIAFALETAPPEGNESGPPELSVQADGESVGTLEDLSGGGGAVVSVPADADEVTLLIADSGIEQTVSLTTGEPGEGNIVVWQRQNRSAPVTGTTTVTGQITLITGETGPSVPLTLGISSVSLTFSAGSIVASGPDRALLSVDDNTLNGAGGALTCSPGCFSLTLPDGTVVGAQDAGGYAVFDVPAAFTDGTVNLNGVLTAGNGDRIDFAASGGTIPVAIPAD